VTLRVGLIRVRLSVTDRDSDSRGRGRRAGGSADSGPRSCQCGVTLNADGHRERVGWRSKMPVIMIVQQLPSVLSLQRLAPAVVRVRSRTAGGVTHGHGGTVTVITVTGAEPWPQAVLAQ
jgi:hypothetical protein